MGSTEIINRTTRAMDIKVGNCQRYSIKLATVGKNQSYTVHVDFHDTYREFTLGACIDHATTAAADVIISSDECVDNKTIIIREEEDGQFKVDMEPRILLRRQPAEPAPRNICEPARKRLCTFLRLWIF